MELSKNPILMEDSIIFRDEDGIFVYSQNQKKVAHLEKFNTFAFNELKNRGFFTLTLTSSENLNQRFSSLILLLSRNCPLRCRYCYADSGNSDSLMSVKVAEKAVEWYLSNKPLKPKISFIGGGEPTLNISVLTNLISKYRDKVRFVITTSGVLSQEFLKWLMENQVNISFSIDGPPDIQNFLRPFRNGGVSSPIVEESIATWKSKKPLSIRATITESSVSRINEILNYFEMLGVNSLHFEPLYNLGRAVENVGIIKQPPVEIWIKAVIAALNWAKQKNKRLTIHALIHFLNPSSGSFCGPMCGNTIVVNHEGKITACSEVVDSENKDWNLFYLGELGRLDAEKSKYLTSRVPVNMDRCKDCFAKYICRGGCAYKGLVASGNLFIPDKRHCEFIKSIVPILIKRMVLNE